MSKINTELLTYNYDATVLVVFSKWLYGVAMTGNHQAACIHALAFECLCHILSTLQCILLVNSCVTCTLVGISIDGNLLVGVLLAPFSHLVEDDFAAYRV